MNNSKNKSAAGFSVVELLIVLAVISILSGIVGYYLTYHRTAYKPDDQALQIIDILQEARQRSLTQRETLRVEIDIVDNMVRLIDENKPDKADDDRMIRQLALAVAGEVKVEQRPAEIFDNPPESLPVPSADFKPSIYPPSTPHRVCTIRFLHTGRIVDAGSNPTGTDADPLSVTLHIWSPNKVNTDESEIARAVTVNSTGSIRMWEYDRASAASNKWIDSRRTGAFGGGGTTATP